MHASEVSLSGSFQNSDLSRPWARRRAASWILVCLVAVVSGLVAAAREHSVVGLLPLAVFAYTGVLTARRLSVHLRHGSGEARRNSSPR